MNAVPRKGDWMQTVSGRQFWPLDPRVGEIFIEDIAHSLSMACRYAGHCLRFYSVAEHSVLMTRWLQANGYSQEEQLTALLHDAPEAYLVDVPRPVKPFLTEYKSIEARLWLMVAAKFGVSPNMPSIVKFADESILADERQQNIAPCPVPWDLQHGPLGVTLQYWHPAQAKSEFLEEFERLTGGLQ